MSTFICSKCGCIDNSAKGGNYWTRFIDVDETGKPLEAPICCECNGKDWHNSFPKEHWTKHGTKEELIAEAKRKQGNYDNAVEYFKHLTTNKEKDNA